MTPSLCCTSLLFSESPSRKSPQARPQHVRERSAGDPDRHGHAEQRREADELAANQLIPLDEHQKGQRADQPPQQTRPDGGLDHFVAMASISTPAPFGNASTPTALLAGGSSSKKDS